MNDGWMRDDITRILGGMHCKFFVVLVVRIFGSCLGVCGVGLVISFGLRRQKISMSRDVCINQLAVESVQL
jgi:hypothetical protein